MQPLMSAVPYVGTRRLMCVRPSTNHNSFESRTTVKGRFLHTFRPGSLCTAITASSKIVAGQPSIVEISKPIGVLKTQQLLMGAATLAVFGGASIFMGQPMYAFLPAVNSVASMLKFMGLSCFAEQAAKQVAVVIGGMLLMAALSANALLGQQHSSAPFASRFKHSRQRMIAAGAASSRGGGSGPSSPSGPRSDEEQVIIKSVRTKDKNAHLNDLAFAGMAVSEAVQVDAPAGCVSITVTHKFDDTGITIETLDSAGTGFFIDIEAPTARDGVAPPPVIRTTFTNAQTYNNPLYQMAPVVVDITPGVASTTVTPGSEGVVQVEEVSVLSSSEDEAAAVTTSTTSTAGSSSGGGSRRHTSTSPPAISAYERAQREAERMLSQDAPRSQAPSPSPLQAAAAAAAAIATTRVTTTQDQAVDIPPVISPRGGRARSSFDDLAESAAADVQAAGVASDEAGNAGARVGGYSRSDSLAAADDTQQEEGAAAPVQPVPGSQQEGGRPGSLVAQVEAVERELAALAADAERLSSALNAIRRSRSPDADDVASQAVMPVGKEAEADEPAARTAIAESTTQVDSNAASRGGSPEPRQPEEQVLTRNAAPSRDRSPEAREASPEAHEAPSDGEQEFLGPYARQRSREASLSLEPGSHVRRMREKSPFFGGLDISQPVLVQRAKSRSSSKSATPAATATAEKAAPAAAATVVEEKVSKPATATAVAERAVATASSTNGVSSALQDVAAATDSAVAGEQDADAAVAAAAEAVATDLKRRRPASPTNRNQSKLFMKNKAASPTSAEKKKKSLAMTNAEPAVIAAAVAWAAVDIGKAVFSKAVPAMRQLAAYAKQKLDKN